MSSRESIATPALPTSPEATGASESCPVRVGRSKATDRSVAPSATSCRYRALDSLAVPDPVYRRVVDGRPGRSPGPRRGSTGSPGPGERGRFVTTGSRPRSSSCAPWRRAGAFPHGTTAREPGRDRISR